MGGGFTGLWAALLAAPHEQVVLLEGERCGDGASGRNGGFVDASLTHGLEQRPGPLARRDRRPVPPEPIRSGVVQLTRRALIRADEDGGRRGPWLKLLDRVGAGFDS